MCVWEGGRFRCSLEQYPRWGTCRILPKCTVLMIEKTRFINSGSWINPESYRIRIADNLLRPVSTLQSLRNHAEPQLRGAGEEIGRCQSSHTALSTPLPTRRAFVKYSHIIFGHIRRSPGLLQTPFDHCKHLVSTILCHITITRPKESSKRDFGVAPIHQHILYILSFSWPSASTRAPSWKLSDGKTELELHSAEIRKLILSSL